MARKDYHERNKNRKTRYKELAEKNQKEEESRLATASNMAGCIPMGQPILVGHHSEKSHRAFLKRIDTNMRKGVEAAEKADYYIRRAASVGTAGISLDNPNATDLIAQEIYRNIENHERMVSTNKILRAIFGRTLRGFTEGKRVLPLDKISEAQKRLKEELGASEDFIKIALVPSKWSPWNIGFQTYALSYSSANIRRLRTRWQQAIKIDDTIKQVDAGEKQNEWEFENDTRVELAADDNRIRIHLPVRPDQAYKKELKSNGYRWSGKNKAWQCYYSGYDSRVTNAKTLAQKYGK